MNARKGYKEGGYVNLNLQSATNHQALTTGMRTQMPLAMGSRVENQQLVGSSMNQQPKAMPMGMNNQPSTEGGSFMDPRLVVDSGFNSQPAVSIKVNRNRLVNFMNYKRKVPLFALLPELQVLLDRDRSMQLWTLTQKLKNDEITLKTFIQEMVTLVGLDVLIQVKDKILQQAAINDVPGQQNMNLSIDVQFPALLLSLDLHVILRALEKDTVHWHIPNTQDRIDQNLLLDCRIPLAPSSTTASHQAINAVAAQPNAEAKSSVSGKRMASDWLDAREVPHICHEDPGRSCSRETLVELQSRSSCPNNGLQGVSTLPDLPENFCKDFDAYKSEAGKPISMLNQQFISNMRSLKEEPATLWKQNKGLMELLDRKDLDIMILEYRLKEAKIQMEEAESKGKLNYLASEEHKEDMRAHAERIKPSVIEEFKVSPEGQAWLSSGGITENSFSINTITERMKSYNK